MNLQSLIPLNSRELWDQINETVKRNNFQSHEGSVKCFTSMAQALIELAQGTSQFLSHKKNVSIFQGATPFCGVLVAHIIRDGVQVQNALAVELPTSLEAAKKWVEALPRETAYVLFPEDHIVTAEVYSWDFLDAALNEKRIYSLRLSHHRHLQAQAQVRPFSVQICVFDIDHIVALCGSRFKTPTGSVAWMNWPQNFCNEIAKLKTRFCDPQLVKEFESELSEYQFLKTSSRVFDRAVLSFPHLNSDRLLKTMDFLNLGLSNTSLCSWDSFALMSGWWKPELSADTLRGLLILPAEALKTANLASQLRVSYEKMQKEQSWVI